MSQFERNIILIGEQGQTRLAKAKVLVLGLGGVGGAVVESLARAGIGRLDIVDNDVVTESNINRQVFALHSTVGQKKCLVAKNRILDINPSCVVNAYDCFFTRDNAKQFDFSVYDYVVDAIDSVNSKVDVALECKAHGVALIAAMGAGNRLSAHFEIADVYKTVNCPLAKKMRSLYKEADIDKLQVVYSPVLPVSKSFNPIGSISYAPNSAGLLISSVVINAIIQNDGVKN